MLAVIRKRNPYFRVGTYVECHDDGCQKVRIAQEGTRMRIVGSEGVVLEQRLLEPFMSRVLRRGFDK